VAGCVARTDIASNRMVNRVATTTINEVSNVPALPDTIHSCPACSHWLPEGTLACPDCQALTYGRYLSAVAASAQQLEAEQKWPEARERWVSALHWLPEETTQAESVRQHIAGIDARAKAAEDQKARWTKRLGPFAPIALFLLKIKSFFFILLKLKFLLSLVAFFGLYWAIYGWQFALGFTSGIAIHEMGHYVAVRRRGLKANLPMFIPGMGAYVTWYGQGVSQEDLAAIALAGPLFGLTVALAFLAMWFAWHAQIFMVLAYVTAWVNLINLIPVFIFDGARATFAMSRMQRGLVAATCLVFFALTVTGGNLMGDSTQWTFAVVGLCMVWRCFTNDEPEKPSTQTFAYFQTLVVVLGLAVLYTYPLAQVTAGR
jgi:Zn-dependent protease